MAQRSIWAAQYGDGRAGTAHDGRRARSPAACARAPGSPASRARGTPGAADPRSPSAAARAVRSTPRRAMRPSRRSPPRQRAVRRSAATRAPPWSARGCRVHRRPRPARPPGSSRTARPVSPSVHAIVNPPSTAGGHVVRMPLDLVRQRRRTRSRSTGVAGQSVRRREAADDRGRRRTQAAAVRDPVLAPQRESGHRRAQRLEPGADRADHEMRLVQRHLALTGTGHLDRSRRIHPGVTISSSYKVEREAEGVEARAEVGAGRRDPDATGHRTGRRSSGQAGDAGDGVGVGRGDRETRPPGRGRARCRCPSGHGL